MIAARRDSSDCDVARVDGITRVNLLATRRGLGGAASCCSNSHDQVVSVHIHPCCTLTSRIDPRSALCNTLLPSDVCAPQVDRRG